MAISEKQSKANANDYAAAMSDRITATVTGRLLVQAPETGEWVGPEKGSPSDKVDALNRHKRLKFGWQGHEFGPDSNGVLREIVGREPKKKKTDATVLRFGDKIPRAAFEFHNRMIRTGENVAHRFEITTDDVQAEDGDSGEQDLSTMKKAELVALGVERGGNADELEAMSVKDLRELLKD